MNNKTFIVVICILAIVSVIGFMAYLPARTDIGTKIKVADFPKVIGEWRGEDMPVDERSYEILETRNLFVRNYKNSKGDSIRFFIVYSEDNRKVSHPPEVCLLGSGATIVDKQSLLVTPSIKGNKIIVEDKDSREMVIYWFKAGKLNTDQYLRQQLKIVLDRMFGKRTSGALIRLSTDIKGDEEQAALSLMKSFCNQIEPLLAKHVP